jgi:ABC-type antimicrobial peptide transport system permease subunit
MRILYPITVAMATLIATGAAVLLMFQNAKEAAVMRMLGQTKRGTRIMLNAEQVILCLVGLLLGLVGLAVMRRDFFAILSWQSLMCAGLYLLGSLIGSITGAVLITNKPPLELLQVRE